MYQNSWGMAHSRLDPNTLSIEVERLLETIYIAAEGASLRQEDRRKAVEVSAMLLEIERTLDRFSKNSFLSLVDAAAGKSYLGLLAASLLLEPRAGESSVITIEQETLRVQRSLQALYRLDTSVPVDCRTGDVRDASLWPERASIVVALHACGPAADTIIDQVITHKASWLLLVPCCTGKKVPSARLAERAANRIGIPRHAPVRRRFIQSYVDSERTWRLEAAGYETEVVEFVGATVTPHNLLWRARRVEEPVRMERARKNYEALVNLEGS